MSKEVAVTVMSAGTPFLDGFSTATAAFLILLVKGFTPVTTACFTSLFYFGSLAGAFIGGFLADRFGRRRLYILAMAVVCTTSLLAVIQPTIGILLLLRLATGIALGGDYPVAQALVTETVSKEHQARALSFLMLGWYIGACFGLVLCQPFLGGTLPWQGILATEAIIAGILLWGRCFIEESPDWKNLCRQRVLRQNNEKSQMQKALTKSIWWKAFLFCCGFWLCQTTPATILMLYGSTILRSLAQTENTLVQMLLLYGFFLVGSYLGTWSYFSSRPKQVMLGTFLAMAFSLVGIVFSFPHYPFMADGCFVLFAVAYGLQTPLDFVYPNMLFATEVRATTVGIITSISRLGAAGAAFSFPLLANNFSISELLGFCSFIGLVGALIGWRGLPMAEKAGNV